MLALLSGIAPGQARATTPASNSPVRKAIVAVIKKRFGKTQKNIDKPDILKVQRNWARVVYDVRANGDEGSTGVNVILKKTGNAWRVVWDFNNSGEDADVSDQIKGIPAGILAPFDK